MSNFPIRWKREWQGECFRQTTLLWNMNSVIRDTSSRVLSFILIIIQRYFAGLARPLVENYDHVWALTRLIGCNSYLPGALEDRASSPTPHSEQEVLSPSPGINRLQGRRLRQNLFCYLLVGLFVPAFFISTTPLFGGICWWLPASFFR